jgi:sulfoxide reductase heme-binding subunit YedZ
MAKSIRLVVFYAGFLPIFVLALAVYNNTLGPDPADALAVETGEWSLRFLLMSLAVTPLRNITGWVQLFPFRRTFGLFALFYASLHFVVYLVFLLRLRWSEIFEDITERPYITVGFFAFLLLVVLGATSNRIAMRKLGVWWRKIHRLVYLVNILALIHLAWILRTDMTEAMIYASILLPLLGYRIYWQYSHR